MRLGKVSDSVLKRSVLKKIKTHREEVILGAYSTALSKAHVGLVAAHHQDHCFRTESFSDSAARNAAC